jgi:hypothetical protein
MSRSSFLHGQCRIGYPGVLLVHEDAKNIQT